VNVFLALIANSFLRLRRDKLFYPAIFVALILFVFASLASDWMIEDVRKALFDLGFFTFHLTGGIIAIFWGIKLISDSATDGSIEVQLALPVGRSTWFVGNFLGLALALVFIGVLLAGIWQAVIYSFGFGLMSQAELVAIGFLLVLWIILAALTTFLAVFTSQGVTLFGSLIAWIVGLASYPVSKIVTPDTPHAMKTLIDAVAYIWDLRQFNLAEFVFEQTWSLPQEMAVAKLTYGGILIVIFVSLGCFVFSRRDIA
jgi:ABC-type transport system involved in multi-copper enzyme maturation permease subunit